MGNNWRGRDGIRMYCKVRFRSENSGPHTANTYRHHIAHRNVSNQPRTVTIDRGSDTMWDGSNMWDLWPLPCPQQKPSKGNFKQKPQGSRWWRGEIWLWPKCPTSYVSYWPPPPSLPTLSPACLLGPTLLERCLSTGWSDIRAHRGDKLKRFHLC